MKSNHENQKLKQKIGKDYRYFEIIENGVLVEYKHQGDYSKYEIEFENIDFAEIVVNKKANKMEVFLLVSIIINICFFILFLLDQVNEEKLSSTIINGVAMGSIGAISVWAAKLFKREYIKHIKGNSTLSFSYRKKEQTEVDEFIGLIKIAKKNYFRSTYLKIDKYIPIQQQKQTFLWLYQTKQIDKAEYENMLEELENIRIIKGE